MSTCVHHIYIENAISTFPLTVAHRFPQGWCHRFHQGWCHRFPQGWCHRFPQGWCHRFPQGWCHRFPQGWCHRFPQGWCHRVSQGWCHRFPQGWRKWLEEHLHDNTKNESVCAWRCSLWGHNLFACPWGFRFLYVFLEAAFSVAVSVHCQSAKLKPRFVAESVCLWLQCQSAKLKPRFVAGGVCLWLQDPEGRGLHGTRQMPVYREASNTATFHLLPPSHLLFLI